MNTWYDTQCLMDFGLLSGEPLKVFIIDWLIDCLLCKVHYYGLQNYRMWVRMGWDPEDLFWGGRWAIEEVNHYSRLGSCRMRRPPSSEVHSWGSFHFPTVPFLHSQYLLLIGQSNKMQCKNTNSVIGVLHVFEVFTKINMICICSSHKHRNYYLISLTCSILLKLVFQVL